MLAKELIRDEIPSLKPSDTGLKAIKWMDEFKVSHLPIVYRRELIGLISDTDILDLKTPEETIAKLNLVLNNYFVYENQHIFEVIKVIAEHNLSLVPVLDERKNYLGIITLNYLMKVIANMSMIKDPGGIIILELNINDYSLSEIAQIVESNDAKILGTFITAFPDSTKMEVTLKINKTDLSAVLQTFNRYDYIVTASYHQSEHGDYLKDRYDSLMKYLNI